MNRFSLKTSRPLIGLPIATSLGTLSKPQSIIDSRVLLLSGLSLILGIVSTLVAKLLTSLIGFVTNIAFYGRISNQFISPSENHLGLWVILIPALGGLLVGIMARFGSRAIRGHGIPEAMEQILFNESKIPARITFLKPISAAISIGTGGPFGAEGPIIATGSALGSLVGQVLKTTAVERKTLVAAGAAAGMTAIFGTPVSAILLAIELLLFEFRPTTFIPVAIASLTAAIFRIHWFGFNSTFSMPQLLPATPFAQACYGIEGIVLGFAAVLITKFVYWIEDQFEKLPIHWMYWPALGGLAVGIIGFIEPQTLGVGYDRIEQILTGNWLGISLISFCVLKFISWSLSLGSGTSGGTLAPLLSIGGALGASLGFLVAHLFPQIGIDVKMAALVGMAATFAGASRALLASIVFAFETTQQVSGLLPLLSGCTTSFLTASFFMRQSIMTEKIARRGRSVPFEYVADPFEHTKVIDCASKEIVTFFEEDEIFAIQSKITSIDNPKYQFLSYPILNRSGEVVGILTREELLGAPQKLGGILKSLIQRPAISIDQNANLSQAIALMNQEKIGRLIVVSHQNPKKPVGYLTLRDLLTPHHKSFQERSYAERSFTLSLNKRNMSCIKIKS
jgi:H+/Cl- antiporter ClcA